MAAKRAASSTLWLSRSPAASVGKSACQTVLSPFTAPPLRPRLDTPGRWRRIGAGAGCAQAPGDRSIGALESPRRVSVVEQANSPSAGFIALIRCAPSGRRVAVEKRPRQGRGAAPRRLSRLLPPQTSFPPRTKRERRSRRHSQRDHRKGSSADRWSVGAGSMTRCRSPRSGEAAHHRRCAGAVAL